MQLESERLFLREFSLSDGQPSMHIPLTLRS
jgi:hypothetical protein